MFFKLSVSPWVTTALAIGFYSNSQRSGRLLILLVVRFKLCLNRRKIYTTYRTIYQTKINPLKQYYTSWLSSTVWHLDEWVNTSLGTFLIWWKSANAKVDEKLYRKSTVSFRHVMQYWVNAISDGQTDRLFVHCIYDTLYRGGQLLDQVGASLQSGDTGCENRRWFALGPFSPDILSDYLK